MISSLCSVALLMVTPPSSTGSSTAQGVSAPVRPRSRGSRGAASRHLRRELPGHGPARLPAADHAEVVVERELVDLHDDAVGLERRGAIIVSYFATACCHGGSRWPGAVRATGSPTPSWSALPLRAASSDPSTTSM